MRYRVRREVREIDRDCCGNNVARVRASVFVNFTVTLTDTQQLGLHDSKLCAFSVRDTRPCLSGNHFCSHFGILDSLFDSIWSDTTAN